MINRYNVLSAENIDAIMRDDGVRIVDMRLPDAYAGGHLPGAIAIDYADLVERRPPILGLLPSIEHLRAVMSRAGLKSTHDIVAYDDEGGGRACRLLWTLDVLGHKGRLILLDGGYAAWKTTGAEPHLQVASPEATQYDVDFLPTATATLETIREHINDPRFRFLDARSSGEYLGTIVRAQRGGHIPGAIHLEWSETMTPDRRMKPPSTLQNLYAMKNITPDHNIVTYCHSHHRSAHSYFVLKWLGFPSVSGFAGSWSEWGNRSDVPVA